MLPLPTHSRRRTRSVSTTANVKPGNVLLGSDGRIKLADFGIARLLSGRSITTTDLYAFTPEHVAPEVLRHDPDGPWSDLYGLASTLGTALLGAPPVRQGEGERVDAYLARKMMARAPRLPESVPRSLADPIERALDPAPERRPSVRDFAEAMAASAARLRHAGRDPRPVGASPAPTAATAVAALPGLAWVRRNARAGDDERSPLRRWLLVLGLCFAIWAVGVVTVVLLTTHNHRGAGSRTTDATTAPTQPSTVPASTAFAPAPPRHDSRHDARHDVRHDTRHDTGDSARIDAGHHTGADDRRNRTDLRGTGAARRHLASRRPDGHRPAADDRGACSGGRRGLSGVAGRGGTIHAYLLRRSQRR